MPSTARRHSNAAGKAPASPAKKVFQFTNKRKLPQSPGKRGNTNSTFVIYRCKYPKDCDHGKAGEFTGNLLIKMLPSRHERNDASNAAVLTKALREHIRWMAEFNVFIVRVYTIEQARLMYTKFIEINADCDVPLNEGD